MKDNLIEAIVEMKEQEVIQITKDLITVGYDPLEILNMGTDAMEIIGERFEKGEYFLPHLIMAGEMLKQMSEVLKPLIQGDYKKESLGKVLIGTVSGDVHDIGKDIVAFLLDVNGFEVKDLGVDVPVDKFVEEIKNFQPQVVALSGLLTVANASMKSTIEAIAEAGLRDQLKIMIGGAQVSEMIADYAGADAYGKDAFEGITLAKRWICGE
jgi:trimethylamine corrinoid protein